MQVNDLHQYLKSLTSTCNSHAFSLFLICNQLPDFSVNGAFATNGLKPNIFTKNYVKLCQEKKIVKKCYIKF